MKTRIIFCLLLKISFLTAMERAHPLLENRKHCCYLQSLPKELLYELTLYVCNENPKNAIHIFDHFNPTNIQADEIVNKYLDVSKTNIPFLKKYLTSLLNSKSKERALLVCYTYDVAQQKIKKAIEKSDQQELQQYLSENTPLLTRVNVEEIKQEVQQKNQKKESSISPFICKEENAKTLGCGCFAAFALIGSSLSGLFIPIPGFNFYQCNQSMENSCEVTSSSFDCFFNETWRLVLCCQQYAYKNCTIQGQRFDDNQSILMPFMPFIVTCSVLATVWATLALIKKCCSPKPISPETESLLKNYQQKMQRKNTEEIAEIV